MAKVSHSNPDLDDCLEGDFDLPDGPDAGEDYINDSSTRETTNERDEYFQSLTDGDY